MDVEPGGREDLLNLMDEMTKRMIEAIKDAVNDGALLSAIKEASKKDEPDLSDEDRDVFSKTIFNGLISAAEIEIAALVQYWKNHIPPEEELYLMTEEELDERVFNPFMEELEKVFYNIPIKYAESFPE